MKMRCDSVVLNLCCRTQNSSCITGNFAQHELRYRAYPMDNDYNHQLRGSGDRISSTVQKSVSWYNRGSFRDNSPTALRLNRALTQVASAFFLKTATCSNRLLKSRSSSNERAHRTPSEPAAFLLLHRMDDHAVVCTTIHHLLKTHSFNHVVQLSPRRVQGRKQEARRAAACAANTHRATRSSISAMVSAREAENQR